jgi:hypothetical protein
MSTHDYFKTLENREFRFAEMKRILNTEPLEKFMSLGHSSHNNVSKETYAKFFIGTFKPLKLKDNIDRLNGDMDFIYDKNSGYVFFNLGGQHAYLMRILYAFYNKLNTEHEQLFSNITEIRHAKSFAFDIDNSQYEINYIDENLGLYFSSANMQEKIISIGENYKLTDKEITIFNNFNFDKI